MKKRVVLSSLEADIEKEAGQYRPVSKVRKMQIERLIDKSRKSRAISFRINEQDLRLLKEKAQKTGLPYQTMINVVLHKYVTDSYLDKEEIDKFLRLKR